MKLILSVTGQETTSIGSLEPQKLSKLIQKNTSRPMFHQVIHLEIHSMGNGGIKMTPRPLETCVYCQLHALQTLKTGSLWSLETQRLLIFSLKNASRTIFIQVIPPEIDSGSIVRVHQALSPLYHANAVSYNPYERQNSHYSVSRAIEIIKIEPKDIVSST